MSRHAHIPVKLLEEITACRDEGLTRSQTRERLKLTRGHLAYLVNRYRILGWTRFTPEQVRACAERLRNSDVRNEKRTRSLRLMRQMTQSECEDYRILRCRHRFSIEEAFELIMQGRKARPSKLPDSMMPKVDRNVRV